MDVEIYFPPLWNKELTKIKNIFWLKFSSQFL